MTTTFNLSKSNRPEKKYSVQFINPTTERLNIIHFGAKNYEDYTIHKDNIRKERYLNRHSKREDWNNPQSAGFWSRWLLWNKPTLKQSIKDTNKKFGIKIILV